MVGGHHYPIGMEAAMEEGTPTNGTGGWTFNFSAFGKLRARSKGGL